MKKMFTSNFIHASSQKYVLSLKLKQLGQHRLGRYHINNYGLKHSNAQCTILQRIDTDQRNIAIIIIINKNHKLITKFYKFR